MVSANAKGESDFLHSNLLSSCIIAKVDTKSCILSSEAEKIAKTSYTGDIEVDSASTEKIIYSLDDYETDPVYSYVVRVYGTTDDGYIDESVLVNAVDRAIIFRTPNLDYSLTKATGRNELDVLKSFDVSYIHDKGIHTYLMYNPNLHVKIYNKDVLHPVTSISNTWTDSEAVSAYTNMCEILQWWERRFKRDSLDDKGGIVDVYIHNIHIDPDNACWNHDFFSRLSGKVLPFISPSGMLIGEKKGFQYSLADNIDVLTHETAHGVLQYSVGEITLLKWGKPQQWNAINEGYADIFACIKDTCLFRQSTNVLKCQWLSFFRRAVLCW